MGLSIPGSHVSGALTPQRASDGPRASTVHYEQATTAPVATAAAYRHLVARLVDHRGVTCLCVDVRTDVVPGLWLDGQPCTVTASLSLVPPRSWDGQPEPEPEPDP
jgi:hypothetical protein